MTVTRLSYDAFGRRRDANNWAFKLPFNLAGPITDHGFGDHETRDELGLIHMGGRTYDPDLGQMMQADAIVQSPLNGQNYNRYSYVFNNPMSYTDPTGFVGEFASSFFNLFSSRSFGFGLPEFLQNDDGQPAAENMLANNMMNGTAKTNPGVAVTSFISNIPSISFDFDGDQLIRTAIDDIEKLNAQVDDFSELGGYPGFFVGRVAQDFITAPVLETLMAAENRDLTGVGVAVFSGVFKTARLKKKLDDAASSLKTEASDIIDGVAFKSGNDSSATKLLPSLQVPNAGGKIVSFVTKEDEIFFRVFSGDNTKGSFLTKVRPISQRGAIEALALPPDNTAEFIQEVLIPAGTRLQRSRALPAFGRRGGKEQFQILDLVPDDSFSSGVPLK